MIRFGNLLLGDVPRIAVPLSDVEVHQDAALVKPYVDVFELRIDQFEQRTPNAARKVCAEAAAHGLPLLGTVRLAAEGGRPGLSESQRLQLFEAVIPLVDAVDIELGAAIRPEVSALAREHGRPLVLSYHDFERTPADDELVAMIDVAGEQGANIVKLAVTAQSLHDTDRLLGLLRAHRERHLILIAMGEHGAMSRVFFPLLGSLLAYGFVRRANAPGQLSAENLCEQLSHYSPEFRRERSRRSLG